MQPVSADNRREVLMVGSVRTKSQPKYERNELAIGSRQKMVRIENAKRGYKDQTRLYWPTVHVERVCFR